MKFGKYLVLKIGSSWLLLERDETGFFYKDLYYEEDTKSSTIHHTDMYFSRYLEYLINTMHYTCISYNTLGEAQEHIFLDLL